MKPLYIFDLDGCLALIHHRRHFVEKPSRDWKAFFAACVDDEPNWPVIRTLAGLFKSGAEIRIWSGRSDEVRAETEFWIASVCAGMHSELRMRPAGDHQPDVTLKMGWLAAMPPEDRDRLVACFDDRDRLVKAYREAGVACFQVAEGDF